MHFMIICAIVHKKNCDSDEGFVFIRKYWMKKRRL